jgi:hypothetical protein
MLLRTIAISTVVLGVQAAAASTLTIDWLDMSPTLFGTSVPNNSNYFLAGIGNVNVSYNIPAAYNHARTTNPSLQNGSVTSGPNTYAWGAHELFAATASSTSASSSWDITFTFSSTVNAGDLYLGIVGLGATTQSPFGAGASVATVLQNGTFIGDYAGAPANNWGPTQFAGGPGIFTMQNSLAAPGGIDPHWNSQLGIVRIDDAVNSLTVRFNQLTGDGVGLNIGVVPAPNTAVLIGLGGLTAFRRRR